MATQLLGLNSDDEIKFEHIIAARQNKQIEAEIFGLFFYGRKKSMKVFNWLRKKLIARQSDLEDLYQDFCVEFVDIVRNKYNHEHANISFKTFCYTKFINMTADYIRRKKRNRMCLETDMQATFGSGKKSHNNGSSIEEAGSIEQFYYSLSVDLGMFRDSVQPEIKFERKYDLDRFVKTIDDPIRRKIMRSIISGLYKPSEIREATLLCKGQYDYAMILLRKDAAIFFKNK